MSSEHWNGIAFVNQHKAPFAEWVITCPCGVEARYPINGLPTKDTLHPCGDLNHYTIRFWSGDIIAKEKS